MKINEFTPLKDQIFVTDMDEGTVVTAGGIILTDDKATDRGIRPRWGKVVFIGPQVDYVEVGEWVLIEHGRWTTRVNFEFPDHSMEVWKIDPAAILLVSDQPYRNERVNLFS